MNNIKVGDTVLFIPANNLIYGPFLISSEIKEGNNKFFLTNQSGSEILRFNEKTLIKLIGDTDRMSFGQWLLNSKETV